MNDVSRPVVTGETSVTFLDQVKGFYWSAPLLCWALPACFLIVFLSPVDGAADEMTFYVTAVGGLIFLSWVVVLGIGYLRLSREQKLVRYRVTVERIEFSDAAGAAVSIP